MSLESILASVLLVTLIIVALVASMVTSRDQTPYERRPNRYTRFPPVTRGGDGKKK